VQASLAASDLIPVPAPAPTPSPALTPIDTSTGDVAVITQTLADRFARGIAAHPADWHMMSPQWLADLSEERRSRLGTS